MIIDSAIGALRPYNFQGKLKLLDPVVPRSGEREATVFGFRKKLDLGEAIQRWIYMGAFEPHETTWVRRWLQPGMTFLDVGANVGYFSLLAASRVGPKGKVIAIEPSPYAFNSLHETTRANSIRQISAHQIGLSDAPGELTLYVQPRGAGFHSPSMSPDSGGDPVTVPVKRLDEVLEELGVATVDLMKMDVEGHEEHVVRGGAASLSSGRIRAVLCEFNEHWLRSQGGSAQGLYKSLLQAGYEDQGSELEAGQETFETRFFVHRSAKKVG